MNRLLVALGAILVSILSIPAFSEESDTIRIARYTESSLAPSREVENPLDAVINIHLPRQMKLVGESVEYLLARSGYRIRESRLVSTPEMFVLFALPIPAQHRAMGTLRLETALKVLAGDAYEFHKNKVTREVWYSLKQEYKDSMVGIDVESYKSRWEERNKVSESVSLVIENEAPAAGIPTVSSADVISGYGTNGVYGPVETGETLGSIAENYRSNGATLSQVMMAMLLKNPESFIDGNMNSLKKGSILKIPSDEEMNSYNVADASAFAERQYQEYLTGSKS